jgi:hypothetical protein
MPVAFQTAPSPFLNTHHTHSSAQLSTAQPQHSHSTATAQPQNSHSTAPHRTAQHSTAQHSTAQHSTAQHSTAQHSTAQHSNTQHRSTEYTHLSNSPTEPSTSFVNPPTAHTLARRFIDGFKTSRTGSKRTRTRCEQRGDGELYNHERGVSAGSGCTYGVRASYPRIQAHQPFPLPQTPPLCHRPLPQPVPHPQWPHTSDVGLEEANAKEHACAHDAGVSQQRTDLQTPPRGGGKEAMKLTAGTSCGAGKTGAGRVMSTVAGNTSHTHAHTDRHTAQTPTKLAQTHAK